METRNKITLSIVGIITVLLITIGITYAYFTANLTGGEEATTITVTGGTMNITYNGGANINVSNIIPSNKPVATKIFTVTGNNTTDIEMKYQISLVVESNDFSEEALKYKLISTNVNNNGIVAPSITTLTNIGTGSKTIELGVGEFASPTGGNKVHTYNLEVYFPNTGENQNIDQEKEIRAYVKTENYTNPQLLLNDYIVGLASAPLSTGVYNENGYRYEGENPNNYILFNNELWRIIGVFDSDTHGTSGQNLVKIIKEESIGEYMWASSSVNNWNTSSLKTYLNSTYYNSINTTNKNLIENITWKLGGYSSVSATTSTFYIAERGTTVYSGHPTSGEGYVGLMYPSDYGYVALATACYRTTNLEYYVDNSCSNQNWLFSGINEYVLTPYSGNSNRVFNIVSIGFLDDNGSINESGVRPSIYLKSSTTMLSGDGTLRDPYIIVE